MNNIQLLQKLQNKLGQNLNLINLMKLSGITKPSNKLEELAKLNQPMLIVIQFMEETEKLLTLTLTKDLQVTKPHQLQQLHKLLLLKKILKLNMTIFGNKNQSFHHMTKWNMLGPRMNSISLMKLSGTNKPNLKLVDPITLIQLTETALQFMEAMETQFTLILTKDPQGTSVVYEQIAKTYLSI